MKGRYPVCCLFLEIDPAAVDVNIHPAKREVKFHREFEIRKLVAQAVRETLLAFHGQESKAQLVTPKQGEGGSPKPKVVGQAKLQPAPEISAPALPNFPEKLRPSPAIEPPKPPGEQPPLRMGFAPSEPVAGEPAVPSSIPSRRSKAKADSILHPRRNQFRNPQLR